MSEPEDQKSERAAWPLMILFGLIAIYFGVFAAITIDEMVLKTYFISQNIPLSPGAEQFIVTIYWPILKLFRIM
ncbi:hypothetical protein [Rubinisphaera margarita]|uniref:hypothetical protein n=1 Tax=Rubinisphaera margarita TaxID=2909586 RepID=UPI001EE990D4|nr:hypothetical protein [Rubinisphaera margarita]MCG6155704.1 hypothetical protein [Rubinisphaera margarita]